MQKHYYERRIRHNGGSRNIHIRPFERNEMRSLPNVNDASLTIRQEAARSRFLIFLGEKHYVFRHKLGESPESHGYDSLTIS